ncbi:MAG: hypothetical protein Q7R33_01785 [Nitrosarchaeum sp.]|nr:hypothetical protein [Nitrosarchaeum sp.]
MKATVTVTVSVNIEDVIKDKVAKFIKTKKSFTSVDVSNAIKTDGIWVSNSIVANWLRKHFYDVRVFPQSYHRTQITVDNSNSAYLYHHNLSRQSDYKNRNLTAITPLEFKTIVNKLQTKSSVNKLNANLEKIVVVSNGRINIPTSIIKAAGLRPGNINPAKFAIPLPIHLTISNDYRLSIAASYLKQKPMNSTKVKISLINGKICFNITK